MIYLRPKEFTPDYDQFQNFSGRNASSTMKATIPRATFRSFARCAAGLLFIASPVAACVSVRPNSSNSETNELKSEIEEKQQTAKGGSGCESGSMGFGERFLELPLSMLLPPPSRHCSRNAWNPSRRWLRGRLFAKRGSW